MPITQYWEECEVCGHGSRTGESLEACGPALEILDTRIQRLSAASTWDEVWNVMDLITTNGVFPQLIRHDRVERVRQAKNPRKFDEMMYGYGRGEDAYEPHVPPLSGERVIVDTEFVDKMRKTKQTTLFPREASE